MMSSISNPRRRRYEKIRELGHNLAGGRVTYLAKDNSTEQLVVIKQFQFAQGSTDWSSYKAYEREIQILQSIQHPGVPRYLNSFETRNGFCMVQEYKAAEPLSAPRSWSPEDVQTVAIATLDILIDLQTRLPPVIHRDIKPENILADEHLNVYLIDFGFARIGSGEGAMSSVAAGTFGFMAPEQIYNRELGLGTDLYGLGATLICLLTGLKSTEMELLMDDVGRFHLESHLPNLDSHFLAWLHRMVQPKPRDRYASAAAAKTALLSPGSEVGPSGIASPPSQPTTTDQVVLTTVLELKATKLGDRISQSIRLQSPESAPPKTPPKQNPPVQIAIAQPEPGVPLQGQWEVLPHPNDPLHTPNAHAWITITPQRFHGLPTECTLTVDTSNLVGDRVYTRQLLLRTHSHPKPYPITLNLYSGAIKPPIQDFNRSLVHLFCVFFLLFSFFFYLCSVAVGKDIYAVDATTLFKLPGYLVSVILARKFWSWGDTLFRRTKRIVEMFGGYAGLIVLLLFLVEVFVALVSKNSTPQAQDCFKNCSTSLSPLTLLISYGFSLLITFGILISISSLDSLWISWVQEHRKIGFGQWFSRANTLLLSIIAALVVGFPIALYVNEGILILAELAISLISLIISGVSMKWQQHTIIQKNIHQASLPGRIQP